MQPAERDVNGTIDIDAIRDSGLCLCEGCQHVIQQQVAKATWLKLTSPSYVFWFCSWSCLRDYCNATVVSNIKPTPPTPTVEEAPE